MTFAQRRNLLTTHSSESIPFVKRPISAFRCNLDSQKQTKIRRCFDWYSCCPSVRFIHRSKQSQMLYYYLSP